MSNFSIENVGAFELGVSVSVMSDGVLEASAHAAPPMTMIPCPLRIDDGALEASAEAAPPMTMIPCPYRIDDSALETTGLSSINPSYGIACSSTQGPMCRRIDVAN